MKCQASLSLKKNNNKNNTRKSENGCVATAGGVQETELNTQTKHCSAKREK